MTATLTATYEAPGTIEVPGYLITVSNLSSITDADSLTVNRHNLSTGEAVPVRGLQDVEVDGDTAISTDYEYEYYNTTGWQYVLTVLDSDGTVLETDTTSTVNGNQSRMDMMAAHPYTTAVIQSVQAPGLSQPIILSEFDTWSIPSRVLGTLNVLGRRNPIVLTDVMGGKTGTFTVLSDRALSNVSRSDLETLLVFNDTYLFQPYYESGALDNFFFKVSGDLVATRSTKAEHVLPASRVTTTVVQYAVPFTEVDRPLATTAGSVSVSWQDVKDAYATWSDVWTAHPNWLDVLNNPGG